MVGTSACDRTPKKGEQEEKRKSEKEALEGQSPLRRYAVRGGVQPSGGRSEPERGPTSRKPLGVMASGIVWKKGFLGAPRTNLGL